MTNLKRLMQNNLLILRQNVLASPYMASEAGWVDLAEAVADINSTIAALQLDQPAGWWRARTLLGPEGPMHLLSQFEDWTNAFVAAAQTEDEQVQRAVG